MLQKNMLVGIALGVLIVASLHFLIGIPLKIIWNSVVGAAILYLVNLTGLIRIEITFLHSLIVGMFGVLGFLFVVIYPKLIKAIRG